MGYIGLGLREHANARADMGYRVIPDARGRGITATAIRLLAPWVFAALGLERLEPRIAPHNAASRRVAACAGFTQERLLRGGLERGGKRRDVIVYARAAGDPWGS